MHVLGTYYEKLVKKSTTLIIWQTLRNREFPQVKCLIYLHSYSFIQYSRDPPKWIQNV